MELTPAQRKIAFAVIVLVLAALGFSLFMPRARGTARSESTGTGQGHQAGPASQAATQAPSGLGAPATPSPAATAAVPDIYRWLPFTPAELARAAAVAVRFGAAYGTFSYTQNPGAYLAPMRNLVSSQLAQALGRAYATLGVASVRDSRKQVSQGSAAVSALRGFGQSSIIFVLAVTERITQVGGSTMSTASYAVTLTRSAASWQVTDIEPAQDGNL